MEEMKMSLEELASFLNEKTVSEILERCDLSIPTPDDLLSIIDNDLLTNKGREVLARTWPRNHLNSFLF